MTSTRPNQQQLTFGFDHEADSATATSELRQEQSASAAMGKSALDSVSMDLMEKIVDDGNMERAWKKVKANRGAPSHRGRKYDATIGRPRCTTRLMEVLFCQADHGARAA